MSISRRRFLQRTALASGAAYAPWLPQLAYHSARGNDPSPRRHVVVLWMTGGPSQLDTFDLKPGHPHGGEFREISTTVPGLKWCEHLPRLAQQAERIAVIRSLTTKEGDHARGTYLIHTGQKPGGSLLYPSLGASFAKNLAPPQATLPNYVSVLPALQINADAFGPGFLGPRYAPAIVQPTRRGASASTGEVPDQGDESNAAVAETAAEPKGDDVPPRDLGMENLAPIADLPPERRQRRSEIWQHLQRNFLGEHPHPTALAHDTIYRSAWDLTQSAHVEAFDVARESAAVRTSYGTGLFGQGCLVARRLIERGVPFVEIALGSESVGWDTHVDNFATVKKLAAELDTGWSRLMLDLHERGLLEQTTILWIGEFGRTPLINANGGRDHFPNAWSCVLAGGGIQGGQAYGRTSADGMLVEDQPVQIGDVLATLCQAAGIDPALEQQAADGRPIKLVEGEPIAALLQ